jgi:hypothetical protein
MKEGFQKQSYFVLDIQSDLFFPWISINHKQHSYYNMLLGRPWSTMVVNQFNTGFFHDVPCIPHGIFRGKCNKCQLFLKVPPKIHFSSETQV